MRPLNLTKLDDIDFVLSGPMTCRDQKRTNRTNRTLQSEIMLPSQPTMASQPSSTKAYQSPRNIIHTSKTQRYFHVRPNKQENIRLQREQQCQTIYQSIIHTQVTQKQTLMEVFRSFHENTLQVIRAKNDKYALNTLIRLQSYNPKIKELLTICNNRLQILPEQLIKLIIYNWIDQQFPLQDVRKFKFDQGLIQALEDINRKFEEVTLSLMDDKFVQFTTKIIQQKNSYKEREFYVKSTLKSRKQMLPLFQKSLGAAIVTNTNFRMLSTDILERMQYEEERVGRFDLVTPMSRRRMQGLNYVVEKLQTNQQDQDQFDDS